jgi:hypothetical protein
MGIYDFFAYTIPGGLLMLAVLYAITRLTPLTIDPMQVSIVQALFFAIASYLVGYILDPLAKYLWYARFEPEDMLREAKADLNRRNDQIKFSDVNIHWYVLLAYIRSKNMDMATEIERFKATEIMMRNVSFVLLFYAALPIIDLTAHGFSIWQGIVTIVSLLGCFLALKQALKFGTWYYGGIFGTVAALELNSELIPIELVDSSQIAENGSAQIINK